MDVKYGKIHRKRIVKSFEIAAYYTLRCIAKKYKTSMRYTFFVGKSERCKVRPQTANRKKTCGLWSVPVPESGQDTGSDYPVFG